MSARHIYRAPGEMPPKRAPGGAVQPVITTGPTPPVHRFLGNLDAIYRAPGEVSPRVNAYGGLGVLFVERPEGLGPVRESGGVASSRFSRITGKPSPVKPVITTGSTPPVHKITPVPKHTSPKANTGGKAPNTVAQPPAKSSPKPAPRTGNPSGTAPAGAYSAKNCPVYAGSGYYVDAAGNCTNDWNNPYSLSLPQGAPAPSPTVSLNGCPTGYQPDAYGNCVATSQTCPAGLYPDDQGNCIPSQGAAGSSTLSSWISSLETWLGEQTIVSGVPNLYIAGPGALLALYLIFRKKGR